MDIYIGEKLRVIHTKMHDWGICKAWNSDTCRVYDDIAAYLGFKDEMDLFDNIGSIDVRKVDLLLGEDGYAIYKVWRARHAK